MKKKVLTAVLLLAFCLALMMPGALAETRQSVIMLEGQEETIEETLFGSWWGFSFWYANDRLDAYHDEKDNMDGVVVEALYSDDYMVLSVISEEDAEEYTEDLDEDIVSLSAEARVQLDVYHDLEDGRYYFLTLVAEKGQYLRAVGEYSEEAAEGNGKFLQRVLDSVAFIEDGEYFSLGEDPIALVVGGHDITRSDLESAATLYMFEAALNCAGYGYGFDITDRLNIEDEVDKLVFDLKSCYVAQDLAQSMGLYPLSAEASAAAAEDAEAAWERYRRIAWSDNGMAFLPAGDYEYIEDDAEGNLVRYFASFGLTKEALLQEAVWDQADDELKKAVTASMTDKSDEEILNYYVDWFLERMDEEYIVENDDVIAQVIDELAEDSSGYEGDGDFEAYERSILIEGYYYTLGESTVRDFEENGREWTQAADGTYSFEVTEEGNDFYVRTDNNQPDGKLVMVDMFYAYEIEYEYLGFGFDLAADMDSDFYTYLEEVYDAEYTDDGVLCARTEVSGGTLLIELGESALRLTLE